VSSVSFINYSIDGTNYSLSTATAGDSITNYGSGTSGTNQTATGVSGFRIGQPNMKINFATQGAAIGTFTLNYLSVNQYDSITLVAPFNINITTYGAPGQFIEGNFTGQIREILNNNLHTVSATFRVRRHL